MVSKHVRGSLDPLFSKLNDNFQENLLEVVSSLLDNFSSKYFIIISLGDFNVDADNKIMKAFYNTCCLINFMKKPTCFKNQIKISCIDLILTNKHRFYNLAGMRCL